MSKSKSNTIPLAEAKLNPSDGHNIAKVSNDKENSEPNEMKKTSDNVADKENVNVDSNILLSKQTPTAKSRLKDKGWKPSSLQFCMQLNDPNSNFGSNFYEPLDSSKNNSGNIWDFSDSESAPASSWSTIPNRYILLLRFISIEPMSLSLIPCKIMN